MVWRARGTVASIVLQDKVEGKPARHWLDDVKESIYLPIYMVH